MLLVSLCLKTIEHVQHCLSQNFDTKDLGDAKRISGMNIHRDKNKFVLILNQISYISKVLSKFSMVCAKGVYIPLVFHFGHVCLTPILLLESNLIPNF